MYFLINNWFDVERYQLQIKHSLAWGTGIFNPESHIEDPNLKFKYFQYTNFQKLC